MEGRLTTGRPDSPWERLEWHESREGWRPEPPAAPELAARKPSYVVVDEIVGDAVGSRSTRGRWPTTRAGCGSRTTARGGSPGRASRRSVWVDDHRVAELAAASSPAAEALATRPLAIGDVFAATTHAEGAGVTPETLLGADFVDLTIDAREAAKLAFYGAVGPPLAEDEAPRRRARGGRRAADRDGDADARAPLMALPEPVPAHFSEPGGSSMRGTTRTSSISPSTSGTATRSCSSCPSEPARGVAASSSTSPRRGSSPPSRALVDAGRLELHPELFAIVVATHPHQDHIGGMARFLDAFEQQIDELWEPGYLHPSGAYKEMMRALEDNEIRHTQPTAGMTRFLSGVKATVLSPGVSPGTGSTPTASRSTTRRSRSSSTSRPCASSRRARTGGCGSPRRSPSCWAAQTLSWSQVLVDFPQLGPDRTPVNEALGKRASSPCARRCSASLITARSTASRSSWSRRSSRS